MEFIARFFTINGEDRVQAWRCSLVHAAQGAVVGVVLGVAYSEWSRDFAVFVCFCFLFVALFLHVVGFVAGIACNEAPHTIGKALALAWPCGFLSALHIGCGQALASARR